MITSRPAGGSHTGAMVNGYKMTIRSRIAPTPSGYLHIGNAVNFLRIWLLVRTAGGSLRLRIDDADNERARPEFVNDIFSQLDWLGLSWDEGPSGPDDFVKNHSQVHRIDRYREFLRQLAATNHLFSCSCSRKQIQQQSAYGLYPGTCRDRRALGSCAAIRIHVPTGSVFTIDNEPIPLCRAMGDFLVWRRNGLPTYQLASLVDDLDYGTTHIVRGRDLMESTAAQLFLASRFSDSAFAQTVFVHHPLITCETGRKLSKSHRDLSLHAMRMAGINPTEIYRLAAHHLGIKPQGIRNLDDLLAAYRQLNPPKALP